MKKTFIAWVIYWLLPLVSMAQTITGKVENQAKVGVGYATIKVVDQSDSTLLFTSTDIKGAFKLNIPNESAKFIIVEHVGYVTKKWPITAIKPNPILQLEPKKDLLDQVVVKSRPIIRQNGDTTSYDVSSFARDEDRSIGDVLNRMPGLQYTDDGKIFYNGQRVNNLLVDGDKILGNNIKLGGDAIRKEQVKDVEVIKDYHERKMMKGKSLSQDMAVNLSLQENLPVKVTGINHVAAGPNKLYDVTSNLTSFNNKFKMINSFNMNNIGKKSNADNIYNPIINGLPLSKPNIDLNRYYNNQTWSNSGAFSKKVFKKLDFNSQLDFFADKDIFGNENEQKYLLEEDQFIYREKQISRSRPLKASFATTFELNESNVFFFNKSQIQFHKNKINTNSNLNGNNIDQAYKQHFLKFNNNFELNKNLKNNFSFLSSWNFNSQQGKEDLFVTPNISIEQWNNKDLHQSFQIPNWNSTAKIGLMKKIGKTNITLSAQHVYVNQTLFSALNEANHEIVPLWANELRWKQNRLTLSPEIFYDKGRLRISTGLYLQNGTWNMRDTIANYQNEENKWYIEPRLFLKYDFNNQNQIQFTTSYNKRFEDIHSMYRNPILTSYRSLEQKFNSLNYRNNISSTIDWKYSKVLSLFFMNLGGSYNSQISNFIISSRLTENGIQNFTLPMDNRIDNWEIRGGTSKYISSTKTNLNLSATANWSFYNQLLNDDIYNYLQNSKNLEFKVSQEFFKDLLWTTTWILGESKNKIRNESIKIPPTNFITNRIESKITYNPGKKFYLNATWKFHHVKQSNAQNWNYNFLDASIRYKINKNYDVELVLYNLTNVKRFETFSLNSIVENHSIYQLRGTMGLLKFTFAL